MGSNPECMLDNPIDAYRAFYATKRHRFKMIWSKRPEPQWWQKTCEFTNMKTKELIEHIDRDEGDLTAIRIDDEQDSVELHGVCGSVDDFDDFDLPKVSILF